MGRTDHDGAYDLVLSRAVLHWVPAADWPEVFTSIRRLVRPGGWVRVECGGAGNIARIQAVMDEVSATFGGPQSPWTFTDASIDNQSTTNSIISSDLYAYMLVSSESPGGADG